MAALALLDDPGPGETETSSELDEAILALRSGAWMTVAGVLMLILSTALNQTGDPAERFTMPTIGWVLLGAVLALQVGAVAAVELGRGWIRSSSSPDGIYRYL